jgi:predicted Zn-dependent peptidase
MPKLSEKLSYAAEVMNAVLGDGMSSRLFQEVREKRGLAYALKCFLEQERDYGHCLIYAGVEKKNIKKTIEVIKNEIKKIRVISSRELDEAREQCIGKWNVEKEQSESTAVKLILQEMATNSSDYYDYTEFISNVKMSDVKKINRISKYSLGMIVPK